MKYFLTIACTLLMSCCATTTANGSTFVASKERTVEVRGPVQAGILRVAERVEYLSKSSTDDIDIIINSPGGSIIAGLQLISAMNVAQARGVRIRCFVPMLAASMAFQILAECNERYALQYSLLLWHPARSFFKGGLKHDQLLYQGERLRKLEIPLMQRLIEKMGIDRRVFRYHYKHETLWRALELRNFSPHFITIVDNFENVRNPFSVR